VLPRWPRNDEPVSPLNTYVFLAVTLQPEEKMNPKTVSSITNKRNFAGGALLAIIGGLGAAGPMQAGTFFGAFASGNATQFQITCGTCPNPITDLSSLNDGGFGNDSATVEFANGNLVSYDSTAVFTGPGSLPHLGALATGNIAVAAPDTFFYAASSAARATQEYTYTGSTPADYTVEYDINGDMAGGILTEISGGFTVFGSGFDPNQEVQPVLGFSFDHANGDGTVKPVHLTGDVTFSVNPGDVVFLQATLDVFADARSQQLFALADASHTLTMNFTQGDPSLLTPAITTPASGVPEPAGVLLMGTGLVALAIAGRRRTAKSPPRSALRLPPPSPTTKR
jgi:hypothetical protein